MKTSLLLLGTALFWFGALSSAAEDRGEDQVRDWIYRAEVFGERDTAVSALRRELAEASPAYHRQLVEAIGIISHDEPTELRELDSTAALEAMSMAEAVITFKRQAFVLIGGHWLQLGDWVGPFFLLALDNEHFLLKHEEGFQKIIHRPEQLRGNGTIDGAWLKDAELADILNFVSRRQKLSSFIPSRIKTRISGFVPFNDWFAFLDRICRENGISWTRHAENLVFHPDTEPSTAASVGRIKGMDRKNINLGAFLQNIAENFNMELILDEGLGDVKVDVHTGDQPWDEVLECLAIMNGFSWTIAEVGRGPSKLIIQKD